MQNTEKSESKAKKTKKNREDLFNNTDNNTVNHVEKPVILMDDNLFLSPKVEKPAIFDDLFLSPKVESNAKKAQKNTKDIYNGLNNLAKNNIETSLEFPLEVFPEVLQEIVKEQKNKSNFDLDLSANSILGAYSMAIGNLFKANIDDIYKASSVIWLIVVSPAGANKSTPLSWYAKPIKEHDQKKFKEYSKEYKKFLEYEKLSKKEKSNIPIVEKPTLKCIISSDVTVEKLARMLQDNPRGVSIHADEINSFIENMNRYNNGSDTEKHLSAWSGEQMLIQRVNSEPIFVKNPNYSIIGGIQKSLLIEIQKKSRDKNGFTDRILWFIKDIKGAPRTKEKTDKILLNQYSKAINKILEIEHFFDSDNDFCSYSLNFSNDADNILFNWHNASIETRNKIKDQHIVSGLAKLEIYVYRLALILELIEWSFSEVETIPTQINFNAASNAIKLIDHYYKAQLNSYFSLISDVAIIDNIKDPSKRELYEALPDEFKKADAVILGNKFNLKIGAINRFIGDPYYFNYHGNAKYSKKY